MDVTAFMAKPTAWRDRIPVIVKELRKKSELVLPRLGERVTYLASYGVHNWIVTVSVQGAAPLSCQK